METYLYSPHGLVKLSKHAKYDRMKQRGISFEDCEEALKKGEWKLSDKQNSRDKVYRVEGKYVNVIVAEKKDKSMVVATVFMSNMIKRKVDKYRKKNKVKLRTAFRRIVKQEKQNELKIIGG